MKVSLTATNNVTIAAKSDSALVQSWASIEQMKSTKIPLLLMLKKTKHVWDKVFRE